MFHYSIMFCRKTLCAICVIFFTLAGCEDPLEPSKREIDIMLKSCNCSRDEAKQMLYENLKMNRELGIESFRLK